MQESSPLKVLVIEDDEDAREVITRILTSLGYTVSEAEDGEVGLRRCRETLPDLIVSDLMMPNVDGLAFVKTFREEFTDTYVPILLLSAVNEIEHKVEGLSLGADDYLTKPFHYRELQARAEALVRVKVLTESLEKRNQQLEELNAKLSQMQKELVGKERELVAAQLAGAAAHKLGQPITTILLNCRMLERVMTESSNSSKADDDASGNKMRRRAVETIKTECESINEVLEQLKIVDVNQTEDYVEDMKILSLDSSKDT